MQYNGGKKKIAKYIAEIVNKNNPQVYWEPFCGMASVGLLVTAPTKIFSDADQAIVSVLQACQEGYEFPTSLSEEEYRAAKLLPPTNPIHGFAKYGCSFGGKPWGGYARNSSKRDYTNEAFKKLKDLKDRFAGSGLAVFQFSCIQVTQETQPPENCDTIYLDPPYAGTARVGAGIPMQDWFWSWAENLAKNHNVFVSEYNAPDNWECVFEHKTSGMRNTTGREKPTEKLFVLKK